MAYQVPCQPPQFRGSDHQWPPLISIGVGLAFRVGCPSWRLWPRPKYDHHQNQDADAVGSETAPRDCPHVQHQVVQPPQCRWEIHLGAAQFGGLRVRKRKDSHPINAWRADPIEGDTGTPLFLLLSRWTTMALSGWTPGSALLQGFVTTIPKSPIPARPEGIQAEADKHTVMQFPWLIKGILDDGTDQSSRWLSKAEIAGNKIKSTALVR